MATGEKALRRSSLKLHAGDAAAAGAEEHIAEGVATFPGAKEGFGFDQSLKHGTYELHCIARAADGVPVAASSAPFEVLPTLLLAITSTAHAGADGDAVKVSYEIAGDLETVSTLEWAVAAPGSAEVSPPLLKPWAVVPATAAGGPPEAE